MTEYVKLSYSISTGGRLIRFDIIFCFLADAVLAIFFNGLITFVVPGAWDGFDSFAGPFPFGEEEVVWNFCKPII